jgi:hypothetical protein
VADDYASEGGEASDGQRLEAEGVGQRARGDHRADRDHAEDGQSQRKAGVAVEKGEGRVRIAKMIDVWMARDSTNQPERNWAGPEWKTQRRRRR